MRRSLSIGIASVTMLAFVVPAAGALDLNLSPWMNTAMSDHYVYWVKKKPRGCKDCNQLWRTNLADGSAAPALNSRKGSIQRLVARGSLIAITEIHKSKSSYYSRVRLINEAGDTRVLAQAAYRSTASRNCGTMVGAGALSASGELAWQRIDVPRTSFKCRYLPNRAVWSAYAGTIDKPIRQIVKPQNQASVLLFAGEALGQIRPIVGFDGVHLLTGPDYGTLTATELGTGATVKYRSGTEVTPYGELGPGGQVATSFFSTTLDQWAPVLFTSPMSATPAIDLHIEGYETSHTKFCGDAIVQVAYNKGDVVVLRRDPAGAIVSTKRFTLDPRTTFPQLLCNQTQGVILYDEEGSLGRIYAEKAFSFELR